MSKMPPGRSGASGMARVVFGHAADGLARVAAGNDLSFARSLGEFGATLMLAGNIPGKTTTIPVAIYFAIQAGDMKQAVYLMVIVLCIAFVSLAALAYLKKPKGANAQACP